MVNTRTFSKPDNFTNNTICDSSQGIREHNSRILEIFQEIQTINFVSPLIYGLDIKPLERKIQKEIIVQITQPAKWAIFLRPDDLKRI